MFDAHSSMSVHTWPFPWNPGLHVHVKDDAEFEQAAIDEQLFPKPQKSTAQEKLPIVFIQVAPLPQL